MTTLFLSIIFSVFSYRLFNEKMSVGPVLLLLIIVVLGVSYYLNFVITLHRIKRKKFDTSTDLTQGLVLAISVLTFLALRYFLKEIVPNERMSLVVAFLLFILSITFTYGVIYFIKYYFIKKYLEVK